MASYNRIKASKTVPIGTIMPWTGSSSSSILLEDAIPNGFVPCNGQVLEAYQYPLLAQILGNTYGPFPDPNNPTQQLGVNFGIVNDYPNYNPSDQNPDHRSGEHVDIFQLPNLNNVSLIDLEGSRIDPEDAVVVGQFITENGSDATPQSNVLSYIDVNFQVESDSQLSGKITGITLQDPAYFATARIIPRKLGVDHTPSHTHAQPEDDSYPSTILAGGYVGLFEAGSFDVQDSEYNTVSSIPVNPDESTADRFNPGTTRLTWYDETAFTLPVLDGFKDYTAASPSVPQIPGAGRNVPGYGNTIDYEDPNTCIINQQQPAISAPYPLAGTYQGFKNHYASGDLRENRGQSTLKPYPVTLNHNADRWNSESLVSHNHFSIDVSMNRGQMRVPGTILINNMTTGTIAPVSVDRALSVQINPNTPSLTTLIIMRVY